MQEMIDCTSVTISINPQDPLPTVSAERSSDIHVYYYDPRAFGSLFTVDCTNVFIHFQPPHREEYKLDLPSEKLDQFVTEMRDSKIIISKVIRGESWLPIHSFRRYIPYSGIFAFSRAEQ